MAREPAAPFPVEVWDSPEDPYDPNFPTYTQRHLILGLDPGRSSIMTIACVIWENGRPTVRRWKLTRGQYYSESGTLRKNEELRDRQQRAGLTAGFKQLKEAWGSARQPLHQEDVLRYIDAYGTFASSWWWFATRPTQAHASLHRFIRQRKVLDKFLGKVLHDARELARKYPQPGTSTPRDIVLMYGSAGPHMAPTAPGEVAVPTTEAYHTALRIFGPNNVHLVNEDYTSKVCNALRGSEVEERR